MANSQEKDVRMSEFEMFEGIAGMFEQAELEAAGLEIGAAVENNAGVQEMAELPDIAVGEQEAINQEIARNPYVQKMWDLTKWAGKQAAAASAGFAIMYGLNKAMAENAHSSGQRTAISSYLAGVEKTFIANGLDWTHEIKQKAAEAALSYPWIDSTA